jgi:hypothetical protein
MKPTHRRKLGVLAVTVLVAVTLSACIAANEGAGWLANHMVKTTVAGSPAGYEVYSGTTPDLGITADTALAMEATGQTAQLPRILTYLEHNISAYVDIPASRTTRAYVDAGHVALLILVSKATGTEAQFATASLLSELRSLQQTSGPDTGLFGLNDPTYDGVFRTALSLQALAAEGASSSTPAVQTGLRWMLAQQCSSGGFTPDVAVNPCNGSPSNYQGPDTNTTAQALLALAATHQPRIAGSPAAKAVAWLASLESSAATFPFYPGSKPDSNSTAIVSVALTAAGQSLAQGHWVKAGHAWPLSALVGYEDTTAGSNYGGYRYQVGDLPESLSTVQVTLALSGVPVPL